jgi:VWFA-related protein
VLLVAGLTGVYAQADAQPAPDTSLAAITHTAPDRAEGLIKLDVMVTDKAGKPAAGLNLSDFRLLEDGHDQKILSFDAFNGLRLGSEPAVEIILLIDTIELPPELARNERNAVEFFLRKDSGRLTRPISVFELSETGLWTITHPSGDGKSLASQIEHHSFSLIRRNAAWHQGTGEITNPSEYALKALGQIATSARRRAGRKLLLWIGPGWGVGTGAVGDLKTDSKLFGAICWFSDLLREAHVVLYSFAVGEMNPGGQLYKDYLAGVHSPREASLISLNRKVLAVQSGGRAMDPTLDLAQEIESCVQEAGAYYRISFDPLPAEQLNQYHDLKVEVDETGLKARTITGYYDQPYYSVDPIPVPKRISIEQLQRILELDESDAEKSRQLSGVELTERLSERRLASLHEIAHGKRTRQELRILADASSFLNPPAEEILTAAPPDATEQARMLAMTWDYLGTTIHKLPDLFAKRSTGRYQETPMYLEGGVNYQPLHLTDSWTTNVRYRNGSEVTDRKAHKLKLGDPELVTYGEFGPVLQGVLDDIHKRGELTWSRWEQGSAGRVAVFGYVIPGDESFYQVAVCCLPDGDGTQGYQRYPRYHGEIAIDPETGAILRLAFQSDLKSTTPLSRSDIMIEYGPVEMGGKNYICPLRSVSILRARSVRILSNWDEWFRIYGPYATMLNDINFDGYHIFRSNSRVLTGFTPDR